MKEQKEEQERLVNPITGKEVDEVIKEKEARARGYFDFQFLLKYLEDDNEFVKYFIIEGKKVLVQLEKPYLHYKKSTQINHERVLQEEKEETQVNQLSNIPVLTTCNLDDEGCISCSG